MFSRPTCLAPSRLFGSVPPCSVSKSVANPLSDKDSRPAASVALPVTLQIRSGRILPRRSSESVEMRRVRCWWACHYDIKVRARQQVRSVPRPWDLS